MNLTQFWLVSFKSMRRSFVLFALLSLPFCVGACTGNSPSTIDGASSVNAPASSATASPSPSPTAETQGRLTIDADRAFKHVEQQVGFGPRPAGSQELIKTRDYIVQELRSYGLRVSTDQFAPKTPDGVKQMYNVTGELAGEKNDIIIISSHYDTKPFKEFTFVGADDGASSTAALLEIARVLASSKTKPKLTYRFVFFDGEEAVCREWDECGTKAEPDHTYGSRYYVKTLKSSGEIKRVKAMILLDMIGYKKLEMGKDDMSTRWLVNTIWDTAHDLGYKEQFPDRPEGVGGDDHEPFLNAGIESVDMIQLGTYEYWHTADDTIDKISPQSLKIVGDVVLASLPKIEQHIAP